MIHLRRLAFAVFFSVSVAFVAAVIDAAAAPAQNAKTEVAAIEEGISAEGFSVQAQLEDLITRRITHELGTRMERDLFTISSQVTVDEAPEENAPAISEEEELPPELLIGDLFPEQMGLTAPEGSLRSLLGKYSIQKIRVSVGVKKDVPEALLASTREWLSQRLKQEYGAKAEGTVTVIEQTPRTEPPEPVRSPFEEFLKKLKDYQELAGQIFLAGALLLAVLLARSMFKAPAGKGSGRDAASAAGMMGAGAGAGAGAAGASAGGSGSGGDDKEKNKSEHSIDSDLRTEAAQAPIAERVRQLAMQLPAGMRQLIQGWAEDGESGLLRMASLLEMVSGSSLTVDIPQEIGSDLLPQFEKLAALSPKERLEIARKVYWDLVSYKSVGAGALFKPFSFLSKLKNEEVRSLVMDQNPRMKALVALSMPDESRKSLVQRLSTSERKALLEVALQVDSIPLNEIREVDSALKTRQPAKTERVVDAQPLLFKLLGSMPVRDEVAILSELAVASPQTLGKIQSSYPSLAFLDQWGDAKLVAILQAVSGDEVLAFLSIKPALEARFLELCPPTVGEIVREDRAANRTLSEDELDLYLGSFQRKLREAVHNGLVKLEEVWNSGKDGISSQNSAA